MDAKFTMEAACQMAFNELNGNVYHLNTSENNPIVFTNETELKYGTSLLGLCAKSIPTIRILTFQLMNNHIHILATGSREDLLSMFARFKRMLERYLNANGRFGVLSSFSPFLQQIMDLPHLRNTIAYINRNAYIVNPSALPFSYPWGANRFFFNPEAKTRHRESGKRMSQVVRQELTHSRMFDYVEGLYMVDGYVSPMSFCDVVYAESFFASARQYFICISKSVESHKDIAKSIGESIFYTDSDLYNIALAIAKEKYNCASIRTMSVVSKIELAQALHYDYNATARQVQRMLCLDENTVSQLFMSDKQCLAGC